MLEECDKCGPFPLKTITDNNDGHVCGSIKSVQWFFLAYFFVSKQN